MLITMRMMANGDLFNLIIGPQAINIGQADGGSVIASDETGEETDEQDNYREYGDDSVEEWETTMSAINSIDITTKLFIVVTIMNSANSNVLFNKAVFFFAAFLTHLSLIAPAEVMLENHPLHDNNIMEDSVFAIEDSVFATDNFFIVDSILNIQYEDFYM